MIRTGLLSGVVALAVTSLPGIAVADSCHSSGAESASEAGTKTCAVASVPEETVCSVCKEKLGENPIQLRADGTTLYDCIFCALLGAEGRGDFSIVAPSASSGEQVTLTKKGRAWKASPSAAVALSLPSSADACGARHLAFASRDEFESYLKAHATLAEEKPEPIPLADVSRIIDSGRPLLPKEAVCPVSQRTFVPDRKTAWTIAEGAVHYFCCAGCKGRFGQAETGRQ